MEKLKLLFYCKILTLHIRVVNKQAMEYQPITNTLPKQNYLPVNFEVYLFSRTVLSLLNLNKIEI